MRENEQDDLNEQPTEQQTTEQQAPAQQLPDEQLPDEQLPGEQLPDEQLPDESAARPSSRRGSRGGRRRSSSAKSGAAKTDAPESEASDAVEAALASEPAAPEPDQTDTPIAPGQEADAQGLASMDPAPESPPAKASSRKTTAAKKATAPKTAAKATAAQKTPAPKASTKTTAKAAAGKNMTMFISVLPGEQVEAAIAENGALQEYYVEMLHQVKTRGNIYKGVINNIDANLQAAFVNYGADKNGFLQIDEVHPEYYLQHHDSAKGRKYPLIQKVLQAGQEVLVQVVKEPTGSKGAFLSTYLSLPGRFLVLTPGREQLGVSRKVEDAEERERLREQIQGLTAGPGLGLIVRTVSLSAGKTMLQKDLQFLKRLWKEVRGRGASEPAPCLIYQEPGLAARAVRDYLTDDVCEIWVDDEATAAQINETIPLIFPRRCSSNLLNIYRDPKKTMWEHFNLLGQINELYSREVVLPSGGRLVFDPTEALMAIDINSGKSAGKSNFEAMALRTNQEAAETIARHIRLRDIGGQIVVDFIEMHDRNHWRDVEKVIRTAMKNDRARHDLGRISAFGLMEIVRQRLGSSALSITMEHCPYCHGSGLRRNMEWQALQALRDIPRKLRQADGGVVVYEVEPELALYLLNHKRDSLSNLEEMYSATLEIRLARPECGE